MLWKQRQKIYIKLPVVIKINTLIVLLEKEYQFVDLIFEIQSAHKFDYYRVFDYIWPDPYLGFYSFLSFLCAKS